MLRDVFSQILSYLLKRTNTTQQVLAKALGVNRATVGQMSNGVNLPSLERLVGIADYFHVSLDYLIGRARLYEEPEGDMKYIFRGEEAIYVGRIHYVFGIVPYDDGRRPRQFMVLNETEGHFLNDMIESRGAFMFLSLAYQLRTELGFEYDAFRNNGADLVLKEDDGYREVSIDVAESAGLHMLSFDEEIVETWVKMSNEQRIEELKKYFYVQDAEKH